jgi:hypothetical protein
LAVSARALHLPRPPRLAAVAGSAQKGGCDYQFGLGGWNMVIGAFADGDWGSQKARSIFPSATSLATRS